MRRVLSIEHGFGLGGLFSNLRRKRWYLYGGTSVSRDEKKCKDDRPRKQEDYDTALLNAKVTAMRSWTAQKSTSFAELYQNSEQEIFGQIDTYLLNPAIMSKCDKKTFTVSVGSVVNVSAIGQLIARNKPQKWAQVADDRYFCRAKSK